MELPFAGWTSALAYWPRGARRLLSRSATASEGPPDRFLVGVAVFSLLATVSEDRPLVRAVDDSQWLDQVSAQALTFISRRLFAERVGLVIAVRTPATVSAWRGLPEPAVGGLADEDARALPDSVFPGRPGRTVADGMTAVIELWDVHAGYGRIDVLHGVSLSITVVPSWPCSVRTEPENPRPCTRSGAHPAEFRQDLVCGHDVTGAPPDVLARVGLCVIP
jgi:hypothetical protein